jgi:hypothetical protein
MDNSSHIPKNQSMILSHVSILRKWKCLVPVKPGYVVAPVCRCPRVFVSVFPLIMVEM